MRNVRCTAKVSLHAAKDAAQTPRRLFFDIVKTESPARTLRSLAPVTPRADAHAALLFAGLQIPHGGESPLTRA